MTPPLRILVADDERDTVFTLMQLLRDDGHGPLLIAISGLYKQSADQILGPWPASITAADQQSLDAAQRA
jgi:CheY-like chemotaxis protein